MPFDTSNWMSKVDDRALLSSLTIPGTHDSAAYTIALPFIATQRMSIVTQLDAGIRYFDFRCGMRADTLHMVHGPTVLGLMLQDVLSLLYAWLEKHPSEALIVQLKKDRPDESSSIPFTHAVIKLIEAYATFWRLAPTTPLLGELRGKIQLFRRFKGNLVSAYGLNVSRWQDNPLSPFTMHAGHATQFTVQDHYRFDTPTAFPQLIEQKAKETAQVIGMASSDPNQTHWYINFASALEFNWSYRYTPQDIAEGTWYTFRRIPGINASLRESLAIKRHQRLGIVAMDFPDEDLLVALIQSNGFRQQDVLQGALFALLVACLLLGVLAFQGSLLKGLLVHERS